jgi:hypothetical protein
MIHRELDRGGSARNNFFPADSYGLLTKSVDVGARPNIGLSAFLLAELISGLSMSLSESGEGVRSGVAPARDSVVTS